MTSIALLAAALSLNGSWDFRFEEGKAYHEFSDPAFEATDSIPVPACYDMLPKWFCKRGSGLYRRTFRLERPVRDARLVIDGMGLTGRFLLDGRDLGVHPYPYARLAIPTGPLAAGEHVLFAVLDNRFDWAYQKLARASYDFYCYGGFYHGVSLEFETRRLFVRTRDYRTGAIEVEVEGSEPVPDGVRTLTFDGRHDVSAAFRNGRARVNVPGFKLWSPAHPNLHVVAFDGLSARFGIRTVEARDRKLWLNGEALYLKGANRHEAHPSCGAATSEALMMTDILNLKAMGGNFFRGAHYQQAPRFLDLCDENGVLVWEESFGWGNGTNELANADFCDQQVRQTREMVRTSFNHPSVIFFAFLNEFKSQTPAGRALAARLVQAIRAEDSGRLVSWANNRRDADDLCSELVDVISINTYPGWIAEWTTPGGSEWLKNDVKRGPTGIDTIVARHRAKGRNQPIIVSEMGTCGIYGQHDPAAAQWTEEFQAEYVGYVLDAVFANPELCGLALWQFTDARSYHFSHVGGSILRCKPLAQNLAGLYDGYRRPKLAARVVADRFKKFVPGR